MADRNTNPSAPIGARPVGAPAKKRPAWLIPLLVVLVLIVLLLLLLSRCGGGDDTNSTNSTNSTAAPAATPTATTATSSATATTVSGDPAGGTGTITSEQGPLLPLADATNIGADGDLSAYAGTDATATAVRVQSVPADEGFWVGSSATDRVWIQLTGQTGESPFKVEQGDSVSFTGQVVENAAGFAQSAGVEDAEGRTLLTAQGQHITVAKSALTLAE